MAVAIPPTDVGPDTYAVGEARFCTLLERETVESPTFLQLMPTKVVERALTTRTIAVKTVIFDSI